MEGQAIVQPHQGELILHKTSEESELSLYDTSHSVEEEDEGDSDSSPDARTRDMEPCSSEIPTSTPLSVDDTKPNKRTPRSLRKHLKANNNSAKKAAFGLKFRSKGTKESIDRSTCSTVVGSTHDDATTCRRVRQGSDLSALSHCTEVSENQAALTTSEETLHDYEPNDVQTGGSEESDSDDANQATTSRRKAFLAERVSHMAPNFEESDWTSKTTRHSLTFVAKIGEDNSDDAETDAMLSKEKIDSSSEDGEGENSEEKEPCIGVDCNGIEASVSSFRHSSSLSMEDTSSHQDINGGVNDDCTSSSNKDIAFDDLSSSGSSSDNEIAFDDSSSSDGGSIQMLGSSMVLADSSREQANKERLRRKKKTCPPKVNCQVSPDFVKTVNTIRLICGKVVNHPHVQHCIVFLIIMNALQMGIATFDAVDQDPTKQALFNKIDMAFLILFTIESALQFIFHGINLFRDGWLTFDFLIVICSWAFSGMQVFRTVRTLRLVGRVEVLRKLCEALMEAIPRLTGILFLFVLIMYIYAVMVTVLFGDMYKRGLTSDDYFSRLDTTLFTLFQMITLDWANIVREVMVTYPYAYVVFSTYLTFTSFILFSLIIGVVCDAVSAIEHDAVLLEQIQQKEDAQERILRMQHQVDYLKKQQKSVLASVQGVLDEIADSERIGGAPLRGSRIGIDARIRRSSRSLTSRRSSMNSSRRSSVGGSRRSSIGLSPSIEGQRMDNDAGFG